MPLFKQESCFTCSVDRPARQSRGVRARRSVFAPGLALAAALCTAAPSALAWQQTSSSPLVIAHYMHTYVLGAAKPTDNRVMRPKALDKEVPKEEESTYFPRELASHAADGSSATEEGFEEAERAHVNGFELLIPPLSIPTSAFSAGLNLLASVAQKENVKIVPDIWADPWKDDYKLYGQHMKQFMAAHPGAFLSKEGKPMFVFYFSNLEKHNSKPDLEILSTRVGEFLAPFGGYASTYTVMYVPYTVKDDLAVPVFHHADALAIWTPQDDWSALHSGVVVEVAKAMSKSISWPVSPSFYQRRAGGDPLEYANSFGASRYVDAWLKAMQLHPAIIEVQTWNDFSEDSSIRSTNATGNTFLDLTSYLHQWLVSNKVPNVRGDRIMLFHPKQLSEAQIANPSAKATNAAWRHKSPTVDYLDCVTFLTAPATVRMELAGQHWDQNIPAGFHEWLVYVPQQAPPARSGEVVATAESYPPSSNFRFVTTAQHLNEGTPQAEIIRNGQTTLSVKSRSPYFASGNYQDLTLIADENPSSPLN